MLYKYQNDWIIIPWSQEHFYQIKKRHWGILLKPFLDSSGVQLRFFYLLFRHCQDCTFESFFIEIITKCIWLSNLFLDTIAVNVKFKSPKSMARFTMINTMGDIKLIRNTWMGTHFRTTGQVMTVRGIHFVYPILWHSSIIKLSHDDSSQSGIFSYQGSTDC